MTTLRERIEGGLIGLLVGDALGVPYEFKPADEIPSLAQIDYEPPGWFPRSHGAVRPGTWSDDGAQALCLLESLLHCGRLDIEDFARRMVNWYEWGHLAVDGYVFDCGIQTGDALSKIRAGVPVMEAARRHEHANGNGALMRVLPLALWHQGSDAELVRDARLSSLPTHGHVRSELCCALYCLWTRNLLHEVNEPWSAAVTTLRSTINADADALAELNTMIRPDDEPSGGGSGYVVDTLDSARMVLPRGDYERVVREAIALGDDTDTTAAVAGGAAGVRDGIQTIPSRWRSQLRGVDIVAPLLERLLAARRAG